MVVPPRRNSKFRRFKKQTTFSKIIFLPLFKYPVKTIKIQTQQSRSIFKLSKLLEQKWTKTRWLLPLVPNRRNSWKCYGKTSNPLFLLQTRFTHSCWRLLFKPGSKSFQIAHIESSCWSFERFSVVRTRPSVLVRSFDLFFRWDLKALLLLLLFEFELDLVLHDMRKGWIDLSWWGFTCLNRECCCGQWWVRFVLWWWDLENCGCVVLGFWFQNCFDDEKWCLIVTGKLLGYLDEFWVLVVMKKTLLELYECS